MNKKQIIFPIEIKAVNHPRSYILQKAFTNDLNSVELVFKLTDCTAADLTGATASILLFMRDGSFFQDVPAISGTDVKYTLTEAQGNHAGVAQAQLIVKSGANEWASDKQKFEIIAGLETVVATEVMIKDWTMLTAEARAYLDEFEANEVTRQQTAAAAESARAQTFTTNEAGRQSTFEAHEDTRETNETARKAAEVARENEENIRIANEAARVNDFSRKADKTYVDAQLADIEQKVDVDIPAQLSAKAPQTDVGALANLLTTAKTSLVNAINELFNSKANKTQEAWITPTLLNGWTNGISPVRYMKDSLGFVHIEGIVTGGVTGVIFELPVGYRPPNSKFEVGMKNALATTQLPQLFEVRSTGGVRLYAEAGNWNINFAFRISYYVGV